MTSNLIRSLLVAILLIAHVVPAMAAPLGGYPYKEIESWAEQGMVFVVRDADGKIVTYAKGKLEKWKSETQMVWVVRDREGKFMTFAHGKIEKWNDGSVRLVLRNKDGKFVAIGKVFVRNAAVVEASDQDLLNILEVF
jgi:hypothetical protein